MNTTAHTPTPWKVSTIDPKGNEFGAAFKVFTPESGYFLIAGENQQGNADFICLAANSHAQLVSALQKSLRLLACQEGPLTENHKLAMAEMQQALTTLTPPTR